MISLAPIDPPKLWRKLSSPNVYTKLVNTIFTAISKAIPIRIFVSLIVGASSGHTQFPSPESLTSLLFTSKDPRPASLPFLPGVLLGSKCSISPKLETLFLFKCTYRHSHFGSIFSHIILLLIA